MILTDPSTRVQLCTRFFHVQYMEKWVYNVQARWYGQHFSSTCNATLLHCKLKSVVVPYYRLPPTSNIVTQQHFVNVASWKNLLKKVDASSTCCNILLLLPVTMFEVGGNTRATTLFKSFRKQCCVASCSNLLLVLLHLKNYKFLKSSEVINYQNKTRHSNLVGAPEQWRS